MLNLSALKPKPKKELNLSALMGEKKIEAPPFSLTDDIFAPTKTTTPTFQLKPITPKAEVPLFASEKAKQLEVEALKAEKEAKKGFIGAGFLQTTKEIGQSIARSFLATGATFEQMSRETSPNIFKALSHAAKTAQFKPEGKFQQALAGTKEPINFESIGQEVLSIGGEEFAEKHEDLSLGVGLFIAGLDITPFGGSKKSVLKVIKETDNLGDALKLLLKLGVSDNLARQYAPDIVSVKTGKEAKLLFDSIANMQLKTKVAPTIAPEAPRGLAPALKAEKGIIPDLQPLAQEARKLDEIVNNFVVNKKSGNELTTILKDKASGTKFLDRERKASITLYHGGSINDLNSVLDRGIDISGVKRATGQKRNVISLTPDFSLAERFGKAGHLNRQLPIPESGKPAVIYKMKVPIEDLFPDTHQINNARLWKKVDIKNTLGDSLIHGNSAIVKNKIYPNQIESVFMWDKKLGDYKEIPFTTQAVKGVKEVGEIPIKGKIGETLPVVIQGETFTLGAGEAITPTIKGLKAAQKLEIKATKLEIKNAEIAVKKAQKLEIKQQKVRQEAIENIQRFRGNTDNIATELKSKNLSNEDIANIVLEDGTKLTDTAKIKRNADGSLSTTIAKKEFDDIAKSYTDEVPKQKWEKRSKLVEGIEIPIKAAKSIELPYVYFERKGLSQIYDPIIQAGRDAETMKTIFLQRFKNAGLFKEGGWFTADRFILSKNEAEGVARYYLARQGKGKFTGELSKSSKKFVEIFDGIIKETEQRFFETAKKMGKTPGKVKNYAPIMTSKDIKLIDAGGSMDWLFRNHPAFFSLKERVKKVPLELYELDYREVAGRWLEGITDFLNYGETTNHLKYLTNSDQFKGIVKEQDWQLISNWLKVITTPELPTSVGGQAVNALSKLLRKGVAIGTLGLNYASVAKQALTQIPITIIEKAPPKLKSQYAKAFGINVADLPSITKRKGDIAIKDLQGKIGRIFTGALTEFDRKNAQIALNGLLDKEYGKFLKEGVEITPEIQKLIEKRAMDRIDMWFGGFFKGQRPEAFRKELGNFILMFLYPLTSQLNGFYRHILTAQGVGKVKAGAEVLAAAVAIAYMEQVIENLSPKWSDEVGMTEDVLISLTGNIPLLSQITWAIAREQDVQISPVIGNINNIIRNISKGEGEKVAWSFAETFGVPKTIRRIKEGMKIMEEGGITDSEGKMLAPVQDTMELVRSFLRGKYGSMAAQDWVRNIGEKSENRRWFIPQVEFLQNGDYERKAELYRQFTSEEQKELRNFLSEGQQKKLDNALKSKTGKRSLEDIFGGKTNKKTLEQIFK